jgi:hypothetical protein
MRCFAKMVVDNRQCANKLCCTEHAYHNIIVYTVICINTILYYIYIFLLYVCIFVRMDMDI